MNNYDDKYNEEYDKDMRRIADSLERISNAIDAIGVTFLCCAGIYIVKSFSTIFII